MTSAQHILVLPLEKWQLSVIATAVDRVKRHHELLALLQSLFEQGAPIDVLFFQMPPVTLTEKHRVFVHPVRTASIACPSAERTINTVHHAVGEVCGTRSASFSP